MKSANIFGAELFNKEIKIIQEAEAFLLGNNHHPDACVEAYRALLDNYRKFCDQTKRLVNIADLQQKDLRDTSRELAEKSSQLQSALDSLNQEVDQRKRLEEELRRLISVDALTNTHSRRSILELGELELKRFERSGAPLSLLMLDIDHFKSINDNYGHAAGDEALRVFSMACQESLRETDLLGRMGGEEFVAIMPDTDSNDALAIAKRILKNVSETRIVTEDYTINLTVSIGLANAEKSDHSIDSVLSRADIALYAAKNNGRNRVEVFSPVSSK